MKILVTGGAGYIGSQTVQQLLAKKHEVAVIDNLYSGHRWAVPENVLFFEGNCGDPEKLSEVFKKFPFEAVMHFAAHTEVGESVLDPHKYYKNNTINTLELIQFCLKNNVLKFIFSSTAAVYGTSPLKFIDETAPMEPINPYGQSKLFSEKLLMDLSSVHSTFRFVILRYFNVAGASLNGKLGQATPRATHLIKAACEVATGKREFLEIFGTDYNTPDGTCIRDYIHVEDISNAHIAAIDYLVSGGKSDLFNCGYEKGYSVKEVIKMIEKVSGKTLKIKTAARRAGDPEQVISSSQKVRKILNWKPQFDNLEVICKTAYDWEKTRG